MSSESFYWKVACGEQTRAVDYVHPPRMLSMEASLVQLALRNRANRQDKKKEGKVSAYR
jgi:hypothetical protein